MRHRFLCMLTLLALPQLAAAEGVQTEAAAQPAADSGMHLAASAAPPLDLHVDPSQLPTLDPPPGPSALDAGGTVGAAAGPQPAARGLSFGLELTPHRYVANGLARNSAADQPGLQDDVERLFEHSTLGLRGTYRF